MEVGKKWKVGIVGGVLLLGGGYMAASTGFAQEPSPDEELQTVEQEIDALNEELVAFLDGNYTSEELQQRSDMLSHMTELRIREAELQE